MTNDNNEQSPTAFLARLAEAVKARDGVDAELAEILATRILTPGGTAGNAASAIRALAAKRADSEVQGD